MDMLLRTNIREHGRSLCRLHAALRFSPEILAQPYEAADTAILEYLRKKKETFMQDIHNILTVALGGLPPPDRYSQRQEREGTAVGQHSTRVLQAPPFGEVPTHFEGVR